MITKSTEIKPRHTEFHLRQIMADQSAPPASRTLASCLIGVSPEFRDGVERRVDELVVQRGVETSEDMAEVLMAVLSEVARQENIEIILCVYRLEE
jgi:hypothetical protein